MAWRDGAIEEHSRGQEPHCHGDTALAPGWREGEDRHGHCWSTHADGVEHSPHPDHGPASVLEQIVGHGCCDQSSQISRQHGHSGQHSISLDVKSQHFLESPESVTWNAL